MGPRPFRACWEQGSTCCRLQPSRPGIANFWIESPEWQTTCSKQSSSTYQQRLQLHTLTPHTQKEHILLRTPHYQTTKLYIVRRLQTETFYTQIILSKTSPSLSSPDCPHCNSPLQKYYLAFSCPHNINPINNLSLEQWESAPARSGAMSPGFGKGSQPPGHRLPTTFPSQYPLTQINAYSSSSQI